MKISANKIWKRIGAVNGLLLILYTAFVLFTQSFSSRDLPLTYYAVFFLLCLLVSAVACPYVIRFLSGLSISGETDGIKKTSGKKNALLRDAGLFSVIFAVFLANYLSYYPGAHSPDSISQYEQAVGNTYNDWHPVLHTLLAFKLPLLLTGNWIGSIVLFQIIGFSAVLTYAVKVIYEYTNKRYALIAALFILLNPQTGSLAMYPWKDISFAICALLMLVYALRIYMSKGEWIKKPFNMAAFVIITVVTTIIRHNALLFTIPLLFAVMFFIGKKRFIIICACAAALIVGIRGPLYAALNVEQPDKRQIETLGLPMTVIGAAVTYDPENVDDETLEFAYKIAPKEVWEEKYVSGSYNYFKNDERSDNNVIEEYGYSKVISMMFGCFKRSSAVCIKALVDLTDQIYSLSAKCGKFIGPNFFIEDNAGGSFNGDQRIRGFCTVYRNFMSEYLEYLFLRYGLYHYLLIASVLSVFSLRKFKNWKRIFFILPVFSYNYITSLLLTGCEDADRFFFYTIVLFPVLLIFIFSGNKRKEENI